MKTALKVIASVAAAALAGQAAAQITFYEREGFQGESFTTRRQVGDFGRFGFNDSASSVVVGGDPGDRWQVCEDVRFNGRCAVLQPGQYPTLRAIGLNNRITSTQALARVDVPAAQVLPAPPAANTSRVVVYEKQDFGGRAITVQQDIADLGRSGFNDRISSVEVFGAHWEICRDGGFAGPCVVLREGRYPSLASMGLENRVSSIRELTRDNGPGSAPARVEFFEGEGLRGRSFATDADLADLRQTGFNDRVSSVQINGGPGGEGFGPAGSLVPVCQPARFRPPRLTAGQAEMTTATKEYRPCCNPPAPACWRCFPKAVSNPPCAAIATASPVCRCRTRGNTSPCPDPSAARSSQHHRQAAEADEQTDSP